MATNPVYELHDPNADPSKISFMTSTGVPLLEIKNNGFYVRGNRIAQDEKEAEKVYNTFHQWLMLNTLTRNY
jgi:hypothetical protein